MLDQIRRKKNEDAFNSNDFVTFYADFGQEFIFESVKKYCEKNNSKLINSGMPGVKKLPIVERLIRTLQEMIAVK